MSRGPVVPVASTRFGPRTGAGRALVGGAVLAAEYLALAVSFDGSTLAEGTDGWAALGRVGALVSISAAVLTAGLLVRGGELLARLKDLTANLPPPELRFAIAHLIAFAGFAAVTSRLFGAGFDSPLVRGPAIGMWLATGAASLAMLFRFTFGPAWRAVARALVGLLAAGLALGMFAWIAGLRSLPLWDWLAGATLRTSAAMLAPFVSEVRVVPNELLLGVGDFDVIVATACSGMENLGAVSVFLLGYFYTFREELRFPRSLLLLPLALVAVWLANAARIAGLVAIGAYVSPDVAFGGFHSKAGWIALCVVALGVVVATRQSPAFSRTEPAAESLTGTATAAYLLPLLTFVGMGFVTGLFAAGIDWFYPVQVVAAGFVAWRYRRDYPLRLRSASVWGLAIGVATFALWVALSPAPDPEALTEHQRKLAAAPGWLRATWLGFRVAGAVVVVPLIEELAFRGFLQRRLIASDFTRVPQNRFTALSLVVSAGAFGLLHDGWLAGITAGVLYSIACYGRGRLGDAFFAHAVTNALLVTAALVFGHHRLWY